MSFYVLCVYNAFMERLKIGAADRAFFVLVSEASFANPFGQRRQDLDHEILGVTKTSHWSLMVPRVIEQVKKKLSVLDQGGVKRLQDFAEQDQAILRNVFLFDIFYGCPCSTHADEHTPSIHAVQAHGRSPRILLASNRTSTSRQVS